MRAPTPYALAALLPLALLAPSSPGGQDDRPAGAAEIEAASRHPAQTAQAVLFHGTVTARSSGAPLRGAQVSLVGTNVGALTDAGGSYRLEAEVARGSEVTLRFRLLGYRAETRSVLVEGDSVRVDIQLRPVAVKLDEAVTVAPSTFQAGRAGPPGSYYPPGFNTESYDRIEEEAFRSPLLHPLSTFAADVDRASYANVRRYLAGGALPPHDAVRIEELVNYFAYPEDPLPEDGRPFAVTAEMAAAPWRPAHRLVRIALRTPEVEVSELPPTNLVFLIDVSGSMSPPNKLPLVQRALAMLVERLRPEDRISIAVYAGAAGTVLEGARGDETARILEALHSLRAGGSTAGGEGLRLAYRLAAEHHRPEGNNRIILATDGDFNVGVSSDSEMQRLVEEKREQGTFLTVLGVGAGNTKFSKMEKIADHGNGQFHYIDGILEAKKALVGEMGGTLLTVAKDVKLQVEFNPERVLGYRLIGYENRRLDPEDFDDDRKDAGDLGAGHSVVAFYEVIPHGADTDVTVRTADSLRYRRPAPAETGADPGDAFDDELAFLKVRYKAPDGERSELLSLPIREEGGSADPASRAFAFGSAVVEFGLVLRDSPFRGDADLERALERAREARGPDREGYRAEFVRLVDLARELSRESAATRDRDAEGRGRF